MKKVCAHRRSSLRDDAYLTPFAGVIRRRQEHAQRVRDRLTGGRMSLLDVAAGHEYYGLHFRGGEWIFREWAPGATAVSLIGQFSGWQESRHCALARVGEHGDWEVRLPEGALKHGDLYRLRVHWPGGAGDRVPAYARRVVQDPHTHIVNAQVWQPEAPFAWRHPDWRPSFDAPFVYESHVGMAQERAGVGTYDEYRRLILPRIQDAGYNTVQLMAVAEHPYYGSFGYHVSSFFAASSRFGTPEELKALVDEAHDRGLAVIIDLVHSHAVRNEVEGLSLFDGTPYQYFHDGPRGDHPLWGSKLFDYGKPQVLHFLLSNCRFWLDEYRLDGYRFDGVTSMLYHHHGMGTAFCSYDMYFDGSIDEDALAYLTLANEVVHAAKPGAITVAEDVSGLPGLGAPPEEGGVGFDYRLAMGVPDFWFKLVREVRDEHWHPGFIWSELTNRRTDEKTISYVECHDQAIVGSKTLLFELADAEVYGHMSVGDPSPLIDRAMALHKMIRLSTLATAGHGYLTFMGNEFGHPEWIDFPREGNGWSYHYARRQWRLRDDPGLKFHWLADFDRAMLRMAGAPPSFVTQTLRLLVSRDADQVLGFERGGLYFLFNFHPARSLTDYFIECLPGVYDHVMDTDQPDFGGHGRIAAGQRFHTQAHTQDGQGRMGILVYLPCRTALVLRRDAGSQTAQPADGVPR